MHEPGGHRDSETVVHQEWAPPVLGPRATLDGPVVVSVSPNPVARGATLTVTGSAFTEQSVIVIDDGINGAYVVDATVFVSSSQLTYVVEDVAVATYSLAVEDGELTSNSVSVEIT